MQVLTDSQYLGIESDQLVNGSSEFFLMQEVITTSATTSVRPSYKVLSDYCVEVISRGNWSVETNFFHYYKINTIRNAYFGIQEASTNSYYQINADVILSNGVHQIGTYEFNMAAYPDAYVGFVADPYAIRLDSQGNFVDSNVAVSSTPVLYSQSSLDLSASADVEVSALSALGVAIDSGLTLSVKNLTATLDTPNFADGRLANGVASATIQLNNVKDLGQEILSLEANAELFPNIYAATSSNGNLTIYSNGLASISEWQAALRALTYQNDAANPTTGVRTVTFDFNDGIHASYTSKQTYVVVTGSGSSDALRAAIEPNDPNNDIKIAFDTGVGENAGAAYRLYGVLDRAPDLEGLSHWMAVLDRGVNVKNVALGFLESDEFQIRYGTNLNDGEFLTLLYNTILDRTPDHAGWDYWFGALAYGAAREDILANFSESDENVANVADLIANGIYYLEWVG